MGNTTGNTANWGTMVKCKDKIYYISKDNIMSMDLAGENREKICEGNYTNFNSADNFIYFTDGASLSKIQYGSNQPISVDNQRSYNYVNIYDKWIYYIDDLSGNLCKTDIDCKEHYLLSEGNYNHIIVYNDWIYANERMIGKSDSEIYIENTIYKISIDGKDKKKIDLVKSASLNSPNFSINDEHIYYTDSEGYLCRMSLDSSDKVVICTDITGHFNVSDQWIYYSNNSDGGKLYKVKTDGSSKSIICDVQAASYINIIDDFIMFYSMDDTKLYMIKTDGTGKTEV